MSEYIRRNKKFELSYGVLVTGLANNKVNSEIVVDTADDLSLDVLDNSDNVLFVVVLSGQSLGA